MRRAMFVLVIVGVLGIVTGCIQLNSAPAARFTANPSSGEMPLLVSFDASSSRDSDGSLVSYAWSFGDGSAGSGAITSHTYSVAGSYVVRLTVTDDGGATDIYTRSIAVSEPAYEITATKLMDDYETNEVAAQLKYGDKLIAVSGYVDSVNINDFTGEPYVKLVGSPGDWALCAVRCTFPISAQASLATLSEGDFVTITGTCERYFLCDVIVDDCRL